MNIQQFKQSLPYLMKASVPALIWGHHGIGKTESVRQFCDDNEYFCRVLNLGTQEVGDIIGLADFVKDKEGNKIATKFMVPDWVKELYDFCVENPDKYGVLFLDEVNRARRDVLQVIFPLLLEKRIHTTVFPSNFYVLAGANPSTQDYIVTDVSDKALLDRFCHVKMAPSKQEWFQYARKQNFDPSVIQFLQEQPKMLQSELEAYSLDEVKPSRRSWEMVHKVLETKPPINLSRELFVGLVGVTAATAFIKSMNTEDKPITAKDVLSSYPKFEKRIKKYSSSKGGRMDMLKYTADSIAEMASQRNQKNDILSKAEKENLSKFLLNIPKDLAFDLCRTIYMEDITRDVIEDNDKLLKLFADAREVEVEGINK